MNEHNGIAAGLTPDEQANALAALERMKKREREGRYRTNPPVPAKLKSMAPGMRVVRPAAAPPTPIPDDDATDD
jgi:hypothetical protein